MCFLSHKRLGVHTGNNPYLQSMHPYVGNVSLGYRSSINFFDLKGEPFSNLRQTHPRLVRIVVRLLSQTHRTQINLFFQHIKLFPTSVKTVPPRIAPPVFIYLRLKWANNYIKKFVAIQTYYILQA